MDAIILCGGAGSRVSEITQDRIPKILIPILGKPFIEYLITSLLIYGIDSFHFSTGILGEKINEYIENDLSPTLKKHIRFLECLREEEPLGTGGGLINAVKRGNFNQDFALVLNGDTLIKPYYTVREMYDLLGPDCFMYIVFGSQMYTSGEYGSFTVENPDSLFPSVSAFNENKKGMNWINCGWYWVPLSQLRNEIIAYCSLEKTLLPKWIQQNPIMLKIKQEDYLDIGSPSAITRTTMLLDNHSA